MYSGGEDVPECQCEICKLIRRFESAKSSRDFDMMAAVSEDTMNLACCEGEDAAVSRSILNGTWPSSVRILTEALEKARSNVVSETT